MEQAPLYIYGILILLQSFFLFWFGKMIYVQKSIVDSFKSQSEYIKNLQETIFDLIKPENIKNIVNLEKAKIEDEYNKALAKHKKRLDTSEMTVKAYQIAWAEMNRVAGRSLDLTEKTLKKSNMFLTVSSFWYLINPQEFNKLTSLLGLDKEDLNIIIKSAEAIFNSLPKEKQR